MTFKYKINGEFNTKPTVKRRRLELSSNDNGGIVDHPNLDPDEDLKNGILDNLSTGNVFAYLDSFESNRLVFILYFFTKLIDELDDNNHYDCVEWFIAYITTIEMGGKNVGVDDINNMLTFIEGITLNKFVGNNHDELFVFKFIRMILDSVILITDDELLWRLTMNVPKIFKYYNDFTLTDFYINTICPIVEGFGGLTDESFLKLLGFCDLFKPIIFISDHRLQSIILNKIQDVKDRGTLIQSVINYKSGENELLIGTHNILFTILYRCYFPDEICYGYISSLINEINDVSRFKHKKMLLYYVIYFCEYLNKDYILFNNGDDIDALTDVLGDLYENRSLIQMVNNFVFLIFDRYDKYKDDYYGNFLNSFFKNVLEGRIFNEEEEKEKQALLKRFDEFYGNPTE